MTYKPRKLLDQFRGAVCLKYYAYRTEQSFVDWIRRLILSQSDPKNQAFSAWIFPSTVGTPQGSSNLNKGFKKVVEEANVKKIRFPDLYQTTVSLMLNHGVPVLVVSKILGHSKTSTTLDIDGYLISVRQAQAAQIMDEIITPILIEMGGKHELEVSK